MRAQLMPLLKALRLHGMAEVLDRELDHAERQGLSPEQLLHRLLQEESRHRQQRRPIYRLGQARLPWSWTLDSFPFALQPTVNRAQIYTLAGLAFLERAENLVFMLSSDTRN